MKVAIYETLEVSDEELDMMADVLDGELSKRRAKRVEAKTFIWRNGAAWDVALRDQWNEQFVDEEDLL